MGEKVNKLKFGAKPRKHAEPELDELDFGIVEQLRLNCKQTWRQLGRKLGVSPVTIVNRVKKLEARGAISGYSARINYSLLGFELDGVMGLNVAGTHYDGVVKELLADADVESVYATTGDYDLIAVFRSKDSRDLSRIVQKFYRLDQVNTKTYFAVNLKKDYLPVAVPAQQFKGKANRN